MLNGEVKTLDEGAVAVPLGPPVTKARATRVPCDTRVGVTL
jgi:hypothetical protein